MAKGAEPDGTVIAPRAVAVAAGRSDPTRAVVAVIKP